MCGIFGYNFLDDNLRENATKGLKHRGPDSNNYYEDRITGITLIHTRLAITDETENGRQPLVDSSGRYVLIFNGEVYNFRELRENLVKYYSFKSNSDTEVILYGLIHYGVDFLNRLDGMYSLAFYDKYEKKIILARDDEGIKPLYYAYISGLLIFSSEVNVMLQSNIIKKEFPIELIAEFLDFHYILGDKTGIRDVYRLPVNKYIEWTPNSGFKLYPKIRQLVHDDSGKFSFDFAHEIQRSVNQQAFGLKSAGLYLSGGIDSTILLACLKETDIKLNTYSVRYDVDNEKDDIKFNTDARIAAVTSSVYGVDHSALTLNSNDLLRSIKGGSMVIGDALVSHPNSLAMQMLSEHARLNSKVVFSGSGADEIFAGYNRHLIANKVDNLITHLRLNGTGIDKKIIKNITLYLYLKFHSQRFSKKIIKNSLNKNNSSEEIQYLMEDITSDSLMKNIMKLDRYTWLRNFSLALSDSTSMSNGLEERVPFLSSTLIRQAEKIKNIQLVNKFEGKLILKKSFQKALKPVMEMQANKRGFSSPIGRWIRLNDQLSKEIGFIISKDYNSELSEYIDYKKISYLLKLHIEGKSYQINNIWAFATLQSYISKLNLSIG